MIYEVTGMWSGYSYMPFYTDSIWCKKVNAVLYIISLVVQFKSVPEV